MNGCHFGDTNQQCLVTGSDNHGHAFGYHDQAVHVHHCKVTYTLTTQAGKTLYKSWGYHEEEQAQAYFCYTKRGNFIKFIKLKSTKNTQVIGLYGLIYGRTYKKTLQVFVLLSNIFLRYFQGDTYRLTQKHEHTGKHSNLQV